MMMRIVKIHYIYITISKNYFPYTVLVFETYLVPKAMMMISSNTSTSTTIQMYI